jgi:hypothetical protein
MYIYIQGLEFRPPGLFQFRYKFLKKVIILESDTKVCRGSNPSQDLYLDRHTNI